MKKSKARKLLSRGFDEVREKVESKSRFLRSCDNCLSFYAEKNDTEEVCQNPSVLAYDICVDGNRVYCAFWKYCGGK